MEKLKIKIIDIIAILLFHICCVKFYYVPFMNNICILLEIIIIIYLMSKINIIINKKYKKVNILFLLFVLVSILSTLISKSNIQESIWFFVKISSMFFFMEIVNEKQEWKNILRNYSFLYLLYAIISIFVDAKFHYLYGKYGLNYLIGNKFAISYSAFMALIFFDTYRENYLEKKISAKLYGIIVFVISVFISYTTDCNTGILCCILYFVLKKINIKRLKSSKNVLCVSIIASIVLIWFRDFILQQKITAFIVENIFNRSLDLSGRIRIYENILNIIFEHPWIGHGYGNSYNILYNRIMAPNTQNALLEWWFNSGICGLSFLLATIASVFNNLKYENTIILKSFIVGIYVFLILGSIEVTIGSAFFVLLACINFGSIKINGVKKERIK